MVTRAPVIVRRAVAADVDSIGALLEEVDELHRRALPWLFRRVDGPEQAAFLDAFLSKADHATFLALTPEGRFAGVLCAFLRPPARAPIVQPAVVLELDALAVKMGFRRQGIGKQLVNTALAWASLAGATRTELGVFDFNEPARAFWASLGFHVLSYRMVRHSEPET
ncbi:MAG TPA: GNAT family N-acetyltransferase [Polyangiaceae bacterium]|jgi:ribosomal protein S18 acetylase RimI-like enzyme|nr:GNAT family N-acetyltransferase [Polyangiaceae bacterium]